MLHQNVIIVSGDITIDINVCNEFPVARSAFLFVQIVCLLNRNVLFTTVPGLALFTNGYCVSLSTQHKGMQTEWNTNMSKRGESENESFLYFCLKNHYIFSINNSEICNRNRSLAIYWIIRLGCVSIYQEPVLRMFHRKTVHSQGK